MNLWKRACGWACWHQDTGWLKQLTFSEATVMLGEFWLAATDARLCPTHSPDLLLAPLIAVAIAVPKRVRSRVGGGGTGQPPPTVEFAFTMYPMALATCTGRGTVQV